MCVCVCVCVCVCAGLRFAEVGALLPPKAIELPADAEESLESVSSTRSLKATQPKPCAPVLRREAVRSI